MVFARGKHTDFLVETGFHDFGCPASGVAPFVMPDFLIVSLYPSFAQAFRARSVFRTFMWFENPFLESWVSELKDFLDFFRERVALILHRGTSSF